MRRNTGWGALLLAAGVAPAPTGAWAQTGTDWLGGLDALTPLPQAAPIFRGQMGVDKADDPNIPLPLGHPRMDVVGGIYTSMEFAMYRQTNPIGHQLAAVRGFTDVDGSVTGDLNGTVVNAVGQVAIHHPRPLGARGISSVPARRPYSRTTCGAKNRSNRAIRSRWAIVSTAAQRSRRVTWRCRR